MPEDRSHQALGDQLVKLAAELDERVTFGPETRRIVMVALTIASNNGRVIGANEMIAQAIQMGFDLRLSLTPGEQAPSTIAEYLGEP